MDNLHPSHASRYPAPGDAGALRVKVTFILLYLLIGGCALFVASYVVTGKYVLIPYIVVPFMLPGVLFLLQLRKYQRYRTIVTFLLYLFTMLGLMKLTSSPDYLVDMFLLPTFIGAAFLALKYRHALMSVSYLLFLYALSSVIVYWFQPFTIIYTNANTSSIVVGFIVSIISALAMFYVFSRSHQQNSELLNNTLQALHKINDDNRLLINVVSHDFRNYLTRVLLQIDTYRNKTSDTQHLAELDDLEGAIHELSELISEVQVVRDLSGGKSEHSKVTVPFDEILTKIELVFRHQLVEKDLSFNKDKIEALELTVNPDIFIHIILANLVGNAIKFSPPRREIALSLEKRAGIPVLTIANDAPAEHLDNLRKLVSGDTVASAPGTSLEMGQGLGIAIMRKFCLAYDIEYALSVALLPDAQLCRVTSRLSFLPD